MRIPTPARLPDSGLVRRVGPERYTILSDVAGSPYHSASMASPPREVPRRGVAHDGEVL